MKIRELGQNDQNFSENNSESDSDDDDEINEDDIKLQINRGTSKKRGDDSSDDDNLVIKNNDRGKSQKGAVPGHN